MLLQSDTHFPYIVYRTLSASGALSRRYPAPLWMLQRGSKVHAISLCNEQLHQTKRQLYHILISLDPFSKGHTHIILKYDLVFCRIHSIYPVVCIGHVYTNGKCLSRWHNSHTQPACRYWCNQPYIVKEGTGGITRPFSGPQNETLYKTWMWRTAAGMKLSWI